ncbi:DUF3307 domain-containing protein [Alkalicaulis satelles]|uniref:DUF3307 domain-containing protein n=1 Tax=Alkalicaulis satelles TaxID=2609175 RepID=A0A5M6ZLB4_9PROT|nr:DUF3307 domain-containing protein [Alkalicaulis satelles]KAA5804477.1 DUF3307 domain-containing protein [Alkalicaulis satelles]
MLETALALLAAHALADFVLQFNWIIANKRKPWAFALHALIVGVTAAAALGLWLGTPGEVWAAVGLVLVSHALVDGLKTWGRMPGFIARILEPQGAPGPRRKFAAFSLDQLAHLGFIALAAFAFPNAFAMGEWAWRLPDAGAGLAMAYALGAGFIIATRTGQFAIALFIERFELPDLETTDPSADQGLKEGGAWIGLLERTAVFVLVLAGQFAAIGFLIAAKSVLRFQYARDRSHSEYVIIGTLASFSWAAGAAVLTAEALQRL